MKRFLSVLLSFALFITIFPILDVKAISPSISAEIVSAVAGDTVEVNVLLSDNPGIIALGLDVSYDTEKLDLLDVKNGDVFPDSCMTAGNNKDFIPYSLIWDEIGSQNNMSNGIVAKLVFTVLPTADGIAEIGISLRRSSTIDSALNKISFSTSNGAVQIKNGGTLKIGELIATKGEEVRVPITLIDNPGIIGLRFSVDYDPKQLLLVGVENTDVLSPASVVWGNDYNAHPYYLSWDDEGTKDIIQNGIIAWLVFKAVDNASGVAKIDLTIDYNSTINSSLKKAKINSENGSITICGEQEISVDKVSAKKGDPIDVPIWIADNPGITSLALDVHYDMEALVLESVDNGEAFPVATTTFGNIFGVSPYTMIWEENNTRNMEGNGKLAILHFRVSENASEGISPITVKLRQNSTVNENLQQVVFNIVNGEVTIEKKQEISISTSSTTSTTTSSATTSSTSVTSTTYSSKTTASTTESTTTSKTTSSTTKATATSSSTSKTTSTSTSNTTSNTTSKTTASSTDSLTQTTESTTQSSNPIDSTTKSTSTTSATTSSSTDSPSTTSGTTGSSTSVTSTTSSSKTTSSTTESTTTSRTTSSTTSSTTSNTTSNTTTSSSTTSATISTATSVTTTASTTENVSTTTESSTMTNSSTTTDSSPTTSASTTTSTSETSTTSVTTSERTTSTNSSGRTTSSTTESTTTSTSSTTSTTSSTSKTTETSSLTSESTTESTSSTTESSTTTSETTSSTTESTTTFTSSTTSTTTSETTSSTTENSTISTSSTSSTTSTSSETTTSTTSTSTPEKYKFGDPNGNGKIDSSDASFVLGVYAILATGGDAGLEEEQIKAADVNKDAKLDAKDASAILSYYSYTSTGGKEDLETFLKS